MSYINIINFGTRRKTFWIVRPLRPLGAMWVMQKDERKTDMLVHRATYEGLGRT